jgi:hypothetical protein
MPKLLILSSNPRRDLNLDREVSDLTKAVQRLGKFELSFGLGVQSQELPGLLAEYSPQVVHFCGHGAGEQGLVFQDELGREQLLSTEILARLFKTFADEINCVVLNACDSDRQAEAIVAHINYVVGMSQPILDKAAYFFATGFYQGLAAGKSIEQAYELGCIAIQIWSETNSASTQTRQYRKLEYVGDVVQPAQLQIAEHLKPVLRKRSAALPSSLDRTSSVQQVLSPAPSDLPPGFVDVVQQEVDRKEYKDQARAAYDNFGQYSAENVVGLTKSEYEQRKILVNKVKEFWIEGFLKPSLPNAAIRLDLKGHSEAITDVSQKIEALSVELDESFEELQDTRIYEEMGQGRTLLILGDPGAGKTIALLQLAQRLIEHCEQDLSLPMPVVFNLSSWAKDRKAIVDWLIDELRSKYQVHQALSHPWITQQQLILLLDGLDEVNEEYRNDCVRALNEFIGLYPQIEVAICSRVKDYEALSDRLHISSALCLQPFSSKQIYQFLDNVGGPLTGLKVLLKTDREIEQLAQTPLVLDLMSVAYQGWSVESLRSQLRSSSTRLQHVFDTYIDRRLARGTASDYSRGDVLRWLSCLASQMIQEKQTVFLIEKMQPSWLQGSEERFYRIVCLVISKPTINLVTGTGLVTGLAVGLISGIVFGSQVGTITGLLISITLSFMTNFLIDSPIKEILPVERLSWSWQRAKSRAIKESFVGIGSGLFFWLPSGVVFGAIAGVFKPDHFLLWVTRGLISGLLFALIFGFIFGLASGVGSTEITQRVVPNQGIRKSFVNGLLMEIEGGLASWGLSWLFFNLSSLGSGEIFGLSGEQFFGLSGGLIAGLKYGGAACIQHITLRQVLF